jgi:hypothetical protein
MRTTLTTLLVVAAFCAGPGARSDRLAATQSEAGMHQQHMTAGVPISFAQLEQTVVLLKQTRAATEKYQDVRVAVADGYQAIGPYTAGMGFHYVKQHAASGFDPERPPILLYEKDHASSGTLRLTGVSYLLVAPSNTQGQPTSSPFPAPLAVWHKHANICVLPDRSIGSNLDAAQCEQQHGKFSTETQWMIHAWIWKDNPTGVFSSTHPSIR